MRRQKLFYVQFLFSFINVLYAQNTLDSLMFEYDRKFWSEKDYIFVKGRSCDEYDVKLNALYEGWKNNPKFIIKYEDQIDSTDLVKHLNFFGSIKSYKNLNKYLPSAVKITNNGFQFGNSIYCDSLDAISIISSSGDRRFQLGNSFEGTMTLWTTFQDVSQYLIMKNHAITRHGFLNNNEYDSEKDYDVGFLRERFLKKYETKYYTFFYDPSVFLAVRNVDSVFLKEDNKLELVLEKLKFDKPGRKIECCLYKDINQKYYMSATPGLGNPFPLAYQNHSVGFGPVEHESIHILMGSCSTLFSEGIVGYYYSTNDSMEWKKNKYIIINNPNFSMREFLENSNTFDFSELSYAVAAHLARYLIETYGLEKYKSASRFENIKDALTKTYNKSIDKISEEWNKYYNKNKTILGEGREIIFKVIAPDIPDTSSIYITGNNDQLGRWNPNSIVMIKQSDGSWIKKLTFSEGTLLSYKITRGSWENEALDSNGNIPANSLLEIVDDSKVIIKISKWKDQLKKNN